MRRYVMFTAATAYIILTLFPAQVRAGKISGSVKVQGIRSPANILVYVVKGPSFAVDPSKAKFVMDQRNLTFGPHILPVMVGARVQFPNNDNVNHNVFSLSRTKKFNLGSYKPGENKTVVFDKPGIVEIRCDVHAEMLGYIMVLKNPFWAVTDDKGRFEIPDLKSSGLNNIKDLPAGTYEIKTWHEKLKTLKKSIVVPKDGQVPIQLTITRGTPGVLYK